MRVLITGGAGFLGFHLARSFESSGAEVVLVDSLARGRRDEDLTSLLGSERVSLVEADLETPGAFSGVTGHFDQVYHLAAVVGVQHVNSDPARVLRVNMRTLLNAIDYFQAGNHGRFFFASTSEAYAWSAKVMAIPIPTPEDVPLAVDRVENGRASYALSKVAGEMLVHHGFSDEPDRFISARFHNVYGPRMGSVHVVPELFLRMRGGERPMVISNALATRAFCFVDDAIRAVRHLMDSAPAGVYNVGNDAEEVRIGDLVRRIATVAGYDEANLELDEVSEPPIPRRCPDIRKLRDTGFAPEIDLDEGIRRTLAWYDANDTPRGV